MQRSSHPELEDQALTEWGFAESEKSKGPRAKVDLLSGSGNDLKWTYDVDGKGVEERVMHFLFDDANNSNDEIKVRIFFISTIRSNQGWLPGNFSICPQTLRSLQKIGLSGTILNSIWSAEGVWAKHGNQCFMNHEEDGALSSFEVCYRYVCGWDTGVGITQFIRTRNAVTYFCINYPTGALSRLEEYMKADPALMHRDFFLDALCADVSLRQWQINIGERRRLLLSHERKYEDEDIEFNESTRQLHRLSRDWNIMSQDCLDFNAQLEFLLLTYRKYMQNLQDVKNEWSVDRRSDMGETFETMRSQCDNGRRWTLVYLERTNIRINLLFHLANQRESRTNTQIASSTATVAEQTRRDSASMITMAAVTMFFLPGTFISAVLSTTFFDFGGEHLQVSRAWWILPTVTIPLMVVVFAIWLGWHYYRFGRTQSPGDGYAGGKKM